MSNEESPDIKKEEDPFNGVEGKTEKKTLTPEEKQQKKKKIIRRSIISCVIIGLAIGALFLGPPNMEPGSYRVELSFNFTTETIEFNITMAPSASTTKVEHFIPIGSTGNSSVVVTNLAYKSSTNSKVEFSVGIVDNANNSIDELKLNSIYGTITGAGMSRKIRPISNSTLFSSELGENIRVFNFRMIVPYKTGIALGLLVLVAGLWITEIVPTIVGAFLVPIVIVVSGISTASVALQPFFDPVIALFFGGFIIAEALKKHNIDRRLALSIVGRASIRPSFLLIILMSVAAFLSMWMSNTASAAVMVPIAIALVTQIETSGKEKDTTGFKKALVLGIGYSATTGGIASVIGTPANPIAIQGLSDVGIEISFLQWLGFGLPFVIIMLLVIWGYLLLVFRP